MRKFVLAIVIALFGVVIVGPRSTTANGTPTIAVSDNNSRSVQVVIQRDDTQAQYILICAINATECIPENASDSTKVVRFDCHVVVGAQHNPHGCRTYNESSGDHYLYPASAEFSNWRINSPANYGLLPAGDYNIKVFESITGTNGTFTNVATELISFPAYTYNYDVEPVIQGEPLVGQTLKIATHSWTPEPTEVAIWWFRCKKTTAKYPDLYQVKLADIPMSWGYKFENNADCAYLNANGTLAEAPDLGPVHIRNMSSVKSYAVQGFTSYTITSADLGYYITASIDLGGGRYFWNATTSIVEQKTAPVNQVAPTSSFKKTKKIKKLTVGAQVSATAGTWKWANTTTIQWYNCTKRQRSTTAINTKQCKAIKRATKVNYKVKKTNQKRFLVAQITATNELGSTTIYANNLGKVR